MSFDQAFRFAMKWEGGATITNDPDDPGGLTKYGISKKAHPDLDIENLTEEDAKKVYMRDYWLNGICDFLPHPVNIVHFDACVNTGITRAARLLQKAADVEDDGIIGPKTREAIKLKDPNLLALAMINERDNFYRELALSRPVMGKYLRGWMNRTEDLRKEITKPVIG